jgi:transcriptional regulator with XRE-family HTH domain
MNIDSKERLKKFGEHLRKLRLKVGLSLSQMAEKTTFDKAKISRIENGKLNITFATMDKLANALGKPITAIVDIYSHCIDSNKQTELL